MTAAPGDATGVRGSAAGRAAGGAMSLRQVRTLLVASLAGELAVGLALRVGVLSTDAGRSPADWLRGLAVAGLAWWVVLSAVAAVSVLRLRGLDRLLRSGQERFTALAATTHEWVWEATPELNLTYCSDGVATLLGLSPPELIGRALPELLVATERSRAYELLAGSIRRGCGWTDVEMLWQHADGRPVLLQGSAVPIRDQAGALVGFRGSRRAAPASAEHRTLLAARQRVLDRLTDQQVSVALQPIVALGSGCWTGVEALPRFPDNRPPDVWFAEAHDTGHGVALELLAARAALETLSHLPSDITVSVNASPGLVLDPEFTELLASVPAHRVCIEITEHLPIHSYEELHAALAPWRERGLRLAVDDTGAGYASFHHVLRLRPDDIKLDRSLLADITSDPARRALVTAIVLLGLELGASITAEGVETPAELETLASLGVDYAQGYLLARPATDPQAWLRWRTRRWLQPPLAVPVTPRIPAAPGES